MSVSGPPQRRRSRWRLIAMLLGVMLAGTGIGLWHIHNGVDESGEQVTLIWPGQPAAAAFSGQKPPVAVSADLAATGAHAESIQVMASQQGDLFLLHERSSLLMWLEAGKEPLQTAALGFVLFSADGDEIGHGAMQPPLLIEPGQKVSTEVVHRRVGEAARIEIRKLP